MAENEQIEGTLTGFEKGKSGMKSDGVTPYTNYKYEITKPDGNKFTCGGFIPPAQFIEKYVIVTYVKKVDGEKTYHNVKNIVEGVPTNAPAMTPAQQVAAPHIGTQQPTPFNQPTTPPKELFNAPFFGMISNQTIRMITIMKEKLTKESFEIIWNEVFERLWKLNVDKRKEKGG